MYHREKQHVLPSLERHFYIKLFHALISPTVDNLFWMVKMMAENYNRILEEYPEYITKEQLYKICKVSKKTALYYLESGLIPCVDSGKKTRRFKISTKDVVMFLEKRNENPNHFRATPGWYRGNGGYKRKPSYVLVPLEKNKKTEVQLKHLLADYPDLLKVKDVSKATGYSTKIVMNWCNSEQLYHFLIRRTFLIPKLSLLDFMMSDDFKGIKMKTNESSTYNKAGANVASYK